jgi:hypothetical protein
MRVSPIGGISGYSTSNNLESHYAREIDDPDIQLRIAENSKHRQVLLALITNPNLDDKVVQALFSRDLDYVTKKLEALGYVEKDWWNIFGKEW